MTIELANHIYRDGEGVPVVLINVYPVDHHMQDVCAKVLADFVDLSDVPDLPIWVPDMADSGASPVLSNADSGPRVANDAYSEALDRLTGAYVDLIKTAGYEQAIWVGLSMGGYVAMDIQCLYPETVAGLALRDTMTVSDGVDDENRLKMADVAEQTNSVEPVMHFAQPAGGDSTVKKTPEFIATMTGWINEQNPADLAWRQRMTYGRPELGTVSETISAPSLVISGELDPSSSPSMMRSLAERITDAGFIDIPNRGHFSAVEHPDTVTRALLSLVRCVQSAQKNAQETSTTADTYFSPLALTYALPFPPLAQGDIDYQVGRRGEPGLIDELLAEPVTKVVLTCGGLVAVPRGQGELVDYGNVKMRLATLPGAYVSAELARYPETVAMFLGSYAGARDKSVVVVDTTHVPETGVPDVGGIVGVDGAVGGVLGTRDSGTVDGALGKNSISGGAAAGMRQLGNAKGNGSVAAAKIAGSLGVPDPAEQGADDAFDDSVGAPVQPLAPKPMLLQQAVTRFDWMGLHGFTPHSNAREVGQATSAITLSIWHSHQRSCPTCGAAVQPALAGQAQRCTNEADGNRVLFPRMEPTVVIAIVDGHGRLLPQHNAAWKDSRLYSVSAGFVEARENLEHACRREAMEETGIKLDEVRYLDSQLWPFPASPMMAFEAHAITTDVRVDGEETMVARWVTRNEYTAELIAGRTAASGRVTIARYMIEEWFGREL